jgi:sugar O-acyltransferase (sialic acid O-acetyltransferase NeuD family)
MTDVLKVIVFGNNNLAEIVYLETQKFGECHFRIEAFCVDKKYVNASLFCGKPLLHLEDALERYPPQEYHMLSTILASSALRSKLVVFNRLKQLGYTLANYASPLADVSQDVRMGENNIILSFCRVGLGAEMGHANLLWHGVLLDHDARVGNGNFFAGGCKTAGFVTVGDSCWLGLNSTVIQQVRLADETFLGAGSVVIRNTDAHTKYVGNPAQAIGAHQDTGIMLDAHGGSKLHAD